jgi:four helix bundle protein
MIKSYRDLVVWQKAMELAVQTYRLCRLLPGTERFGLVSQLQRAAVAIPANLAEGHERRSRGDYRRYVSVALGSLAEVETHLELVHRLEFASSEATQGIELLAAEVGRMLSALLRRLKS